MNLTKTLITRPVRCLPRGQLGEGAFAVVKRAVHRETDTTYALKIVNRQSLSKSMERALRDEIVILHELDHPHVVSCSSILMRVSRARTF